MCVTAAIALCQRKLTAWTAVGVVASLLGMLLLTQPLYIFQNSGLFRNPTSNWTSPCYAEATVLGLSANTSGMRVKSTDTNITVNTSALHEQETMQPLHYTHNRQWVGYLLLVGCAVAVALTMLLAAKLQQEIASEVVIFWAAGGSTILNLIASCIFEDMVFFSGWFCTTIAMVHVVFSAAYSTLFLWVAKYMLPVVQTLTLNCGVLVLMLAQYTVMRRVNPGLGNWVEVLGAVICFVAGGVGPLGDMLLQHRSKKEEYANLDEDPDSADTSGH